MPAYSSTQSGPFNSASTWGGSGTPSADGDTFTINYGHDVELSTDARPTNGFGDSSIFGRLKMTSGGKLRMNGILRIQGNNSGTGPFQAGNTGTGSELNMSSNTVIEIKGTNAETHCIWVENNRYADTILQGSAKNHTSVLSTATAIGATSLNVANTSGFAVEDWISVYVQDHDHRVSPDEGFIVHDISGNTVYFRQFVTPTATITTASANVITVDNSKVFREGYKLIFGTGANRNIRTITSINYTINRITLDSSITGTVTGLTVYQTGTEKPHVLNSIVAKVATTLTSNHSTNATTINVGSASDIAVGDKLIIEHNIVTDTAWDYAADYVVTAKSGTTLTITPALRYAYRQGAKVVNLTRDCEIKAVDTSTTNRVFFYREIDTGTNAFFRRTRMKNVKFTGLGRNTISTNYGGLMIGGRNTHLIEGNADNRYNFASSIEACVYDSPNSRDAYTGFAIRDAYRMQLRNNVAYNCWSGYWFWSTNYGHRTANNYIQRTTSTGLNIETFYDTFYQSLEYNYLTRIAGSSYAIAHLTSNPGQIRHNVAKYTPTAFNFIYNNGGVSVGERWYHDYYINSPYIQARNSRATVIDSYFGNAWNTLGPTSSHQVRSYIDFVGTGDNYLDRAPVDNVLTSVENNFEYDGLLEWAPWAVREWNHTEQAWFQRPSGNNGNNSGFGEKIYVPAGATVFVSVEVKLVPGFSGTYPYLIATSNTDTLNRGRYQTAASDTTAPTQPTGGSAYGFWNSVQFTAAASSAYEKKTITLEPSPKSYYLQVMLITTSTTASEGFYAKEFRIAVNKSTQLPRTSAVDATSQRGNVKIRQNADIPKKRIGGRL